MIELPLCPHCGQPITRSEFNMDPEGLIMPRRERQILVCLISAKGRYLTKEALAWLIYGDDPSGGPDAAEDVIMAHMSKLRRRLWRIGWTVENKRFEGYRLKKLEGGNDG